MLYKVSYVFLFFIVYSFLGWICEIIFVSIKEKRLVKTRGFLLGPVCPIYGFGGLIMFLYLSKYKNDPVLLFTSSIMLFAILEYFTSYAMEKMFKARWWDYSNHKFNLNGRITLNTLPLFGLLGLVVIYGLNPILNILLTKLSSNSVIIIAIVILVVFLIDNIISFSVILKFKNTVNKTKDNTAEINEYVKETLNKYLLSRRLINAFPNLKIIKYAKMKTKL
ncbi:MAG: putative ABC transporter permease [Tenericutes bacterium]|nr:putative ABC transporter permease [Mycoplasmatota bacterium]